MTDVAVVGSINQDLTIMTERHPLPGETVLGFSHFSGGGGKGANQAVAAARLGASVAMVGRVGDDEFGNTLRSSLTREGIDTSHVMVDSASPTGVALITVDSSAENTIVVSPGANHRIDAHQLTASAELLTGARVVLCQLEIPIEAVALTAELTGGIFCLNPAPGMELSADLLTRTDVLIPNRTELAMITGLATPDVRSALASARQIAGPGAVVVTLGVEGALVVDGDGEYHVAAPEVSPVDTTGAGDAFCGALAVGLAKGCPLVDAVQWATVAGALATTTLGAQSSMPTSADVEAYVSAHGLPPLS